MKFLDYRYNRAVYWLTLALFALLYGVARLVAPGNVKVQEVLLIFACVPRLHDIGRSGWWAVLVLAAEFTAIIAASFLSPGHIYTVGGVFMLVAAGLMIWLGAVPGQPDANKWGDPPAPGLRDGLVRRKARPQKAPPAPDSPAL